MQSARRVTDVFGFGTAGDIFEAHMAMYTVQADLMVCVLSGLVRNIGPCRESLGHQVKEVEKAGIDVTTFRK